MPARHIVGFNDEISNANDICTMAHRHQGRGISAALVFEVYAGCAHKYAFLNTTFQTTWGGKRQINANSVAILVICAGSLETTHVT